MYYLEVKEEADKTFKKLSKKNVHQLRIIDKNLKEVREYPYGYKFLHQPLHGFNRVHIDSSFVLVFKIDHVLRKIIVYYVDHHDFIYSWRPKEEW